MLQGNHTNLQYSAVNNTPDLLSKSSERLVRHLAPLMNTHIHHRCCNKPPVQINHWCTYRSTQVLIQTSNAVCSWSTDLIQRERRDTTDVYTHHTCCNKPPVPKCAPTLLMYTQILNRCMQCCTWSTDQVQREGLVYTHITGAATNHKCCVHLIYWPGPKRETSSPLMYTQIHNRCCNKPPVQILGTTGVYKHQKGHHRCCNKPQVQYALDRLTKYTERLVRQLLLTIANAVLEHEMNLSWSVTG